MCWHQRFRGESGSALLLALLALALLSLLGLFVSLNATTGVQISDNYESHVQATYAALAGLSHARVLFRGLALNDVLRGPDGIYDASAAYLAEARRYRFRYPLPVLTAQSLSIQNPVPDVAGLPDDGLMNTGMYNGAPGIVLIPHAGISQTAPNPYAPGTIVTSRYFVKVTDNNGEAAEIAGDSDDSPFSDGDGIVIVRSMGIAGTMNSTVGPSARKNAVAVFEGRFKRLSAWTLGPALIALGSGVAADLDGAFEIAGGAFPGIGTIDPVPGDSLFPDRILRSAAAGKGDITGGGLPNPSIQDITDRVNRDKDQRLLLSPAYLWDFIYRQAPRMADGFYDGNQIWPEGGAPYLGSYDPAKPYNAPDQDPVITVVNGDLQMAGRVSGGGLLVVTGRLLCSGPFAYNGLILLIGSGSLQLTGSGAVIEGAIFAANLTDAGGVKDFGIPGLSINGKSRIASNAEAVRVAVGLIPPTQISFREIDGSDP